MRANMNEVIKPSKVNPLNYFSVVGVGVVLVLVLVVLVLVFFFEICYNGIDRIYRRGSWVPS